MLKEIEVKQKQVLKIQQTKENLDSNHKIHQAKGELQNKLEESIDLLIVLSKESKEDASEIKIKV